jgi:hypothetical protein
MPLPLVGPFGPAGFVTGGPGAFGLCARIPATVFATAAAAFAAAFRAASAAVSGAGLAREFTLFMGAFAPGTLMFHGIIHRTLDSACKNLFYSDL